MNHLESSFTGRNNFWRYLVMFVAVLLASNTIGSIPLLVAYVLRAAADPSVISHLANNPSDLASLGLDPNLSFLFMLVPFVAGLFAFVFLIRPLNGRSFKMTINGTGKIRWNRFFISAGIWFILSAIYLFIYIRSDPSNFSLENTSFRSLLVLVLISVTLIPFQASFEEVLFRGYLMQGFAVMARNRWVPLILTSLIFGLMHSFNPEVKEYGFLTMMAQYVLFGLTFGIITILDDGIEASVGAHTANNIFLCIMVTNSSSALQTPAVYEQHVVYPWMEYGALFITAIIFLIILWRVLGWKRLSLLFSKVEGNALKTQIP